MRISFDFDSTLTEEYIQKLYLLLKGSPGTELFIITSRNEKHHLYTNKDVFEMAVKLQIPRDNIYFTEGLPKANYVKQLNIDLHFDDMEDEVDLINTTTDTKAFLVGFKLSALAYLKQ